MVGDADEGCPSGASKQHADQIWPWVHHDGAGKLANWQLPAMRA
jgi:hypothetical protein